MTPQPAARQKGGRHGHQHALRWAGGEANKQLERLGRGSICSATCAFCGAGTSAGAAQHLMLHGQVGEWSLLSAGEDLRPPVRLGW